MPTATGLGASADGAATRVRPAGSAPRISFDRRRQLPWVAAGVVLVVGCALLFATVALRTSSSRPVLLIARSLPAGHVLAPGDLAAVSLPGASAVASLPAALEASVVGRPLAVGLLAGSLLTPAALGPASAVSAGEAVVAIAMKAGQYPPMLGPGDQIQILDTAASTAGTPATPTSGPVSAVVLAVDTAPAGSPAAAVISVQVAQSTDAEVADLAAAGDASLVLLPAAAA
ncbi:MAG: hypothetical protein ACYDAQ_19910, partial [Mycobacteriales bacterium]